MQTSQRIRPAPSLGLGIDRISGFCSWLTFLCPNRRARTWRRRWMHNNRQKTQTVRIVFARLNIHFLRRSAGNKVCLCTAVKRVEWVAAVSKKTNKNESKTIYLIPWQFKESETFCFAVPSPALHIDATVEVAFGSIYTWEPILIAYRPTGEFR